jgi:DNA polymerase
VEDLSQATALLEQSLRVRRDLLGLDRATVTKATLAKLRQARSQKSSKANHHGQTFFGRGNLGADLMFVSHSAAGDKDDLSQPFEGPAGQLLGKIIGAMGISCDDIYLATVLTGHLGSTSKPLQKQAGEVRLSEQITKVQPRVLVALGQDALAGIFHPDHPPDSERGPWLNFQGIPLLPTDHPSSLLHLDSKTEKRRVWEGMLLVMEKLEMAVSEKQRGFFRSSP